MYRLLFFIVISNFCMSMDQLDSVSSQEYTNNFTVVLPTEIKYMVFNQVPCFSLNSFYNFLMMQSINKDCNSVVSALTIKKWKTMLEYILCTKKISELEEVRQFAYLLPTVYTNQNTLDALEKYSVFQEEKITMFDESDHI